MKKVVISILIIIAFLATSSTVLAYDTATHPYLTKLIIDRWHALGRQQFNREQLDWLAVGSAAEDEPAWRSLNHFYDPVYNRGLTMEGQTLGLPLTRWAVAEAEQGEPIFQGNFSWPRALIAYRAGRHEEALIALGHILHLVEDAALPAHTRNDQHAEGDVYESWVKNKMASANADLRLDLSRVRPADCPDVASCLEELAAYTNGHWFSADTLSDKIYSAPWQQMELRDDWYLWANNQPVAHYDTFSGQLALDNKVNLATWRDEVPRVVGYGLRILDLFFAATKETKTSAPKPPAIAALKIYAPAQEPLASKQWQNLGERFFPIVDESRNIPRQYLSPAPDPFTPLTPPLVLGQTIVNEALPAPNGSEGSEADGPPAEDEADEEIIPPTLPPIEPVDSQPPTAFFNDLAKYYRVNHFIVSWQGEDNQTPTAELRYWLETRFNSNDWQPWLSNIATSTAQLGPPLINGTIIDLRLKARDAAGNESGWQTASTKIEQPNAHEPVIYDRLAYSFSFDECRGDWTYEQVWQMPTPANFVWQDGRWGCGPGLTPGASDQFNAALPQALSGAELGLSFFVREPLAGAPPLGGWWRLLLTDQAGKISAGIVRAPLAAYLYLNDELYPLVVNWPRDNAWHHLAVAFSTQFYQYLKLYVDALAAGEVPLTASGEPPTVGAIEAADQLTITASEAPAEFDEIIIWTKPLSRDAVGLYYNTRHPLIYPPNYD